MQTVFFFFFFKDLNSAKFIAFDDNRYTTSASFYKAPISLLWE